MARTRLAKAIRTAVAGLIAAFAAGTVFPALAKEPTPPGMETRELPLGTIFTGPNGMALYIYDNDRAASRSTCVNACATLWPPLVAPPDAKPEGPWTIVTRADDTRQWALNGSPLYSFSRDTVPDLPLGEGVLDNWHLADKLAPRPRAVRYYGALIGRVAADLNGRTLYTSDNDGLAGQNCKGDCLRTWIPLAAPEAAARVGADWAPVERPDDGTRQWAYKGKPVYTYANDLSPGDITGSGVDAVWRPVIVEAFPPIPGWVTLQPTDLGQVFADADGRTLYYLQTDLATFEKLACPEDCYRTNFRPVLAEDGAAAPGINWTIMKNPDGKMQWAFRGAPIFTFAEDQKPGDIYGDRFGVSTGSGAWRALTPSLMRPPVL